MRVEIEAFGDTPLSRELMRWSHAAGDPTEAMEDVADEMEDLIAVNFGTEGRSGGTPWRPLKAATLAEKRRRGLDHRRLHATYRLRDGLTRRHHPDHVRRVTAEEVFAGSRNRVGKHHQHGAPRAGVPRRRPVQFRAIQKHELVQILQRWFHAQRGR